MLDIDTDNALSKAFTTLWTEVSKAKSAGVAAIPPQLPELAEKFLATEMDSLLTILGDHSAILLTSHIAKLATGHVTATPRLAASLKLAGLGSVLPPSGSRHVGGRALPFLEFLSLRPRDWGDLGRCLLHAACQVAVHRLLEGSVGKTEPELTSEISTKLRGVLADVAFPAFAASGLRLPEGEVLEFATCSMQKGSDLMGSDLAVVVGTRVSGVPRFRMVLIQAKRAEAELKADVSQGDGSQLNELLSTGMGAYLFYPKTDRMGPLAPTVRSAEAVFDDMGRSGGGYSVSTVAGRDGSLAQGLAGFIGIAMTSDAVSGPGRLFPDAKSVAAALGAMRPRPFRILALNRTDQLAVLQIVEAAAKAYYKPGDDDPLTLADFEGGLDDDPGVKLG